MESKIQEKILEWLRSIGAYSIKIILATKSGEPDIVACLDGKFLAIECKDVNEKPTVLQAYKLRQINNCGGIAYSARSVQEAKDKLKLAVGGE